MSAPPKLRAYLLLCAVALFAPSAAHGQELRGLWVDAFHNGMKSASQVTELVANARAGNFNALFVQVRKRGDAYYASTLEPKATDITPASFDPLADLISKAHSGSPRLAVHAWIVTYNIWNNQSTNPTQPTHPYLLHPDWLTQTASGTQWDGANYAFDPGHPAVQQHTFDVCMDLASRYNIDGLHFDYIRYTDGGSTVGNQPYGYNPVALQRFRAHTGRVDTPAATDSQWLQWRRDQVSALVRKVYLHCWKIRPTAQISAALIAYGSAPANNTASAWQSRDAYGRVLQDWRSWLQEGILDLGVPMIYRDDSIAARAAEFDAWTAYARTNQFNRAAAAGIGSYLCEVGGTIAQIKDSRLMTGGNALVGLVSYSYATRNRKLISGTTYQTNYVSLAEYLNALTDPLTAGNYDPGGTPVFQHPVQVPTMPWKTDSTRGHVMGFVRNLSGTAFDGATVTLTGPQNRVILTDATGFAGAVDLPVGTYQVNVAIPGYRPTHTTLNITGARVAEFDFLIPELPFEITTVHWNPAARTMTLTWNSKPGKTYRIESNTNLSSSWTTLAASVTSAGHTTVWTSPAQSAGATRGFFRVLENP